MSESKASILHVTRYNYVQEIDGKGKYSPDHVSDLFPYTGARIELAPGIHTVAVEYRTRMSYSKGKSKLKYHFLPGKEYFLHSDVKYLRDRTNAMKSYVVFAINECGIEAEQEYNKRASKVDTWLNPFAPACGKK